MKDCEKISDVATEMGCGEIYFADDEFQKSRLWKLRRNVAHSVKSQSIYKEEDTVVPRAFLPELLETVKAVGQKYGFESVCYGHAGDGNLHVNILKGELTREQWTNEVPKGIREIFYKVKELGGTISGEHGIGWIQKPYMDIMFDPYHLSLFLSIKKVFDPNNILNPSKIVP
jgi:glycolate oxidase